MIVEMRRVLIFGPKRLVAEVMEEVQRMGVVHIDRIEAEETPVAALQLDESTSTRQAVLERLRMRADGLLSLLPAVGVETPARADDLTAADVNALEVEIGAIETDVQALTRRRLEAEEEQELIRTYEGAVRVLAPLQNALAGSRALKTVGFILRGKDLTVVAALRSMLVELTQGRVEVVSRTVEEGKIGVVVAYTHRDEEGVRGFLTQAGISELRLPARYGEGDPLEAIRLMERRKAALPAELAARCLDRAPARIADGDVHARALEDLDEGADPARRARARRRAVRRVQRDEVHVRVKPERDRRELVRLLVRVVHAVDHRPLDRGPVVRALAPTRDGLDQVVERPQAVRGHQFVAKLVVGGVEAHRETHLVVRVGQPLDRRHDADGRDRDVS